MANSNDTQQLRCRRRFLRFFPDGFKDERYLSWERDYKAEAHTRWTAELSGRRLVQSLAARHYHDRGNFISENRCTRALLDGIATVVFSDFEMRAVPGGLASISTAFVMALINEYRPGAPIG